MDEKPFFNLKSNSDVLFLFDYIDFELNFDFSPYENIKLLAFSYGVYAAGAVAKKLPKFESKTAINGTLIAIDDEYGVPLKKFLLTEKMNSESIAKFRARLFSEEKHLEMFEQHLPQRSAQSCTEELIGIKKYFQNNPHPQLNFDKVYIGKLDKVIPVKNQINFWKKMNHNNIIEIDYGHFPFYNYNSFEEIL